MAGVATRERDNGPGDVLAEHVLATTGVTTRECGDDGPGDGESDFKGVLHAE